jgi:hypothetical protein
MHTKQKAKVLLSLMYSTNMFSSACRSRWSLAYQQRLHLPVHLLPTAAAAAGGGAGTWQPHLAHGAAGGTTQQQALHRAQQQAGAHTSHQLIVSCALS